MASSQLNRANQLINAYLSSDSPYPYFVSVDGSDEYKSIINEHLSFAKIHISSYCEQEDSFPNVDRLFAAIQKLGDNCILLGIGESAFLGCESADILLGKLKDLVLPHKLVVVCRGMRSSIRKIDESDQKFNDRRFVMIDSSVDYYVMRLAEDIPLPTDAAQVSVKRGFRNLLAYLEHGNSGTVLTKSSLPLKNVREVRTCYMLLHEEDRINEIDESVLSEECWRSYLEDDDLDGYSLTEWRTFLKLLINGTDSPYLQLVISKSENYMAYKKMLLQALLFANESDVDFEVLYNDRRKILEKEIEETDMVSYVVEAKRLGNRRIHYLTDITRIERQAIVEDIVTNGEIPADISRVYPALSEYLFDYAFNCSDGELFSNYFSRYKRQKLLNEIEPTFLEQVFNLAQDGNRVYTSLESRNSIIERLYSPGDFLYWVDALGVEYLGYIQARAQALGLSMNTHIARASLPTLTSLNKEFYDNWPGEKCSSKKLDELKHNGEEGPESKIGEFPTHIARELEIIDEFLALAQRQLVSHDFKRFVIASDHGASRLAVIYDCENKWAMQTKGEHSGRCCPVNEIDERPPCSTEEHEYWVLANYDRFKGSRKAYVEVHGGASLEEVLVPIIELTLKNASIEVQCITETTYSSFKEYPTVELFSISSLKHLSVRLNGKVYCASAIDDNLYEVVFDDLKKIGTYTAEAYEGDDLIGEITFSVQKRTAKTNDDDWFN